MTEAVSLRSYEIMDFVDVDQRNFIRLDPVDSKTAMLRMRAIEEWLESRATDEYLIVMSTVMFMSEKDAVLFKLGFDFRD